MSKFKVGDKVEVTNLRQCTDTFKIGDTFIVDAIDYNDYQDSENWYRRGNVGGDFCYGDELELAKPLRIDTPILDVNYILLPNSVTVSFSGKLVTLKTEDHRYKQTIEAIKANKLEDIPSIIDLKEIFKDSDELDLVDGVITISGKRVPDIITDRVLKFKAQNLPFEPLLKFSEKLLENPSFNSKQMLYKFLEHNGHPITKDGNFIAYKKVTTDFKDCYSSKMDNSIGAIVTMDRSDVDDNPLNTCSSGLHVAAYKYASNFSRGHLVEVEIDPRDVVAVPNDYDGEKMRVCKYKVVKICESKLEDVELYEDTPPPIPTICDYYGDYLEIGDTVELLNDIDYFYAGDSAKIIEILYQENLIFVDDGDNRSWIKAYNLELI